MCKCVFAHIDTFVRLCLYIVHVMYVHTYTDTRVCASALVGSCVCKCKCMSILHVLYTCPCGNI